MMQRLTTGVALVAFVLSGLLYARSVVRGARRRGEHVRTRDALLAILVNAAWLTLAAFVMWMMLNRGW
jgi:hypothetical protein